MKRLMLVPAIAAIALTFGVNHAAAHTPSVSVDCDKLTVTLTDYSAGAQVTMVYGGAQLQAQAPAQAGAQTFVLERTSGRNWSVVIDAPGVGDLSQSGTKTGCDDGTTTTTIVCPSGQPPREDALCPCPAFDDMCFDTTTTSDETTTTLGTTTSTTSTTVAEQTTTTSTPAVTTTTAKPPTSTLPATGGSSNAEIALAALAILVFGCTALTIAARRR